MDTVTIGETVFSGSIGPELFPAMADTVITFSSDLSITDDGFSICAEPYITVAPTPAPTPYFAVTSGACGLETPGCVTSPGYPQEYGASEACSITVQNDAALTFSVSLSTTFKFSLLCK